MPEKKFYAALIFTLLLSCCLMADVDRFNAFVGGSDLTDPVVAASEAAKGISSRIGKETIKAVLVFESFGTDQHQREQMLDVLSEYFPAETIYGSNGFGPITNQSNRIKISIAVFTGDLEVASDISDLGEDCSRYEQAGKQLKEFVSGRISALPEKGNDLAILLGDMHVPDNDIVAGQFSEISDAGCTVVGAAHPRKGFLYYKGKIYRKHCMCLHFHGDFNCRVSMGRSDGIEGVVESAANVSRQTAKIAAKPEIVMVFNCASRQAVMGKEIMRELYAIKSVFDETAICGFYSSGEIGYIPEQKQACGRGQMISVCSIFAGSE